MAAGRLINLFRGAPYAARSAIGRSPLLRDIRNLWAFPGLSLHATVNVRVAGNLVYGSHSAIDEGSNLLVPSGASLAVGANCYVGRYVELAPGGTISIGDRASVQDRSILVGDVKLGRYNVLSLNVLMTSGRHYYDRWPHLLIRDQDDEVVRDARAFREHSKPIVVEDDCWLGVNSVVMPGVKVGRGCVIGSNAVVTRDLPPYSVAVGVPARIVRRRLEFSPPDRLSWMEPRLFPYFYSGFELAADERARNAVFQGHIARGNFAIWLADKKGRKIGLRIRSLDRSVIRAEREGAEISLTQEWRDVVAESETASGALAFHVHGQPVVVSDAWLA